MTDDRWKIGSIDETIAYQEGRGSGWLDAGDAQTAKRAVDLFNAFAGIPDPAAYVAAFEGMREALEAHRAWAVSLTVCDMNEIVADGGITAGMVVTQEANEQVRRLDRALTAARQARGGE